MSYVTWASNVNQTILDATTITVGDGGRLEDSGENGTFKQYRLTSLAVPDKFNVTMDFNWLEKDSNGLSEFDRFMNWYKTVHCRGTKPFQFPSITKFNQYGSQSMAYYRITAASLSCQKSGFCFRVTMEWTEYIANAISIPTQTSTVNSISCLKTDSVRTVYVNYSGTLSTVPALSDFTFTINGTSVTATKVTPNYALTNSYAYTLSGTWTTGTYTVVATYTEGGSQCTKQFILVV